MVFHLVLVPAPSLGRENSNTQANRSANTTLVTLFKMKIHFYKTTGSCADYIVMRNTKVAVNMLTNGSWSISIMLSLEKLILT